MHGIHEYCTKTQKKYLKVCKNAPREAKNGPAGIKSEPRWTKMSPPGDPFAHLGGTIGDRGRSFTHKYTFL